jgi:hypothetical protein
MPEYTRPITDAQRPTILYKLYRDSKFAASFKIHRCCAKYHPSKRGFELQDPSPRSKFYDDAEWNVEHLLPKNASPPLWHFGLVHAGEVNLYLANFLDT